MRLRFDVTSLLDLARYYRLEADRHRRDAERLATTTVELTYVEHAKRATARAEKLERMAKLGNEFILMPVAPFDGGPPSLLVVGGSDAKDGSAFVTKKSKRA